MKKILSLLLAILYVTASSGVVLNVHYCMGKVSSVKVDNFRETFCKCGKKQSSDCCQSELKVVRISIDQNATVLPAGIDAPVAILSSSFLFIDIDKSTAQVIEQPVVNGPPLPADNKLYIANRVFRI